MATNVDLGGNVLYVDGIKTNVTTTGVPNIATASTGSISVKQAVNNVNDAIPTKTELTTSFGNPVTLGRGFIGTVDDADGNTNGYIVWCSDTDFFWLKGTKAV